VDVGTLNGYRAAIGLLAEAKPSLAGEAPGHRARSERPFATPFRRTHAIIQQGVQVR
jgi:hypothetical protein